MAQLIHGANRAGFDWRGPSLTDTREGRETLRQALERAEMAKKAHNAKSELSRSGALEDVEEELRVQDKRHSFPRDRYTLGVNWARREIELFTGGTKTWESLEGVLKAYDRMEPDKLLIAAMEEAVEVVTAKTPEEMRAEAIQASAMFLQVARHLDALPERCAAEFKAQEVRPVGSIGGKRGDGCGTDE